MDTLRVLLDPLDRGVIPRRVAVLQDSGLVVDRLWAPDAAEVDVLSEIAHLFFATEPRRPGDLLRRALIDDVPTAWDALRDDISLGIPVPVRGFEEHVVRHLSARPTATRAYVCGHLLLAAGPDAGAWKTLDLSAVVRHLAALDSEAAFLVFQRVLETAPLPIAQVAEILRATPGAAAMFLGHPHLVQLVSVDRELPGALCDYAASRPVAQRYPALAIVAIMCHSGMKFAHPVGLDTLRSLRKAKFDVALAAAAAVIAQQSAPESPDIAALAGIVETLAANLQKALTSTPTPATRDPAN